MDILNKRDIPLDIALNVPDVESAISVCRHSDLLMCYPYSAVKHIVAEALSLLNPYR
ncbi:hypothetical protein JCM19240_5231 [Vibrio maritimus]|uniref:Uncharacterized protein n=1 Tax=Vibrio maritimus TaxID=990268 RepID=A0A090SVJ7_9VIBR|nr:hypothetical protein JCM19240_5231 [Vibrio maritimus]